MQHIYLSPHFDDAVLSCGGQIALWAEAGETVVVTTVFGGKPDYANLSPFAQEIHGRPLAGDDPVEVRRQEDRQAMAILNAVARPGLYLDCIYRQDEQRTRWLYDNRAALFGPVSPAERSLAFELAQVFATQVPTADQCVLYAPLAVGNHVDHQIVRKAALLLVNEGYTCRFYEDFPYVDQDPAALEAALARPHRSRWRPEIVSLDADSVARKIQAIRAYRSQLDTLFPVEDSGEQAALSAARVTPAIMSMARKIASHSDAGQYAERLWQVPGRPGRGTNDAEQGNVIVPVADKPFAGQQTRAAAGAANPGPGHPARPEDVPPSQATSPQPASGLWTWILGWLRRFLLGQ